METTCFEDGIGRRWRTMEPSGVEVETLLLSRELSEAESTEKALVERAGHLAAFTHAAFAPVLRVERLPGGPAVVSAAVPGTRLSEILTSAQRKWVAPDLDATRFIVAQVAVALADFHRHSRDMSHGAIGPERIVVRPDGRAVIVEHILAPVIQQLQMARTPLWTEFRVPVPPLAGTARFDQMTDVMQLGVLALALVLGRPIRTDEYPNRLHDLLIEASSGEGLAERRPVSRAMHSWVHRALQMEPRSSFRTAADAATAFETVLAEEPRHRVSPAAVVKYLAACGSEAQGGWKVPAIFAAPPVAVAAPPAAPVHAGPVPTVSAAASAANGVHRQTATGPSPLAHPVQTMSPRERLSQFASNALGVSVDLAWRLDWPAVRKALRVSVLSLGLVALFGVTYLGARGYLNMTGLTGGRGTLVVDSRPAGVEVFVDGFASGRTPATLELGAGEHTLVLRTGRGITLVPVVVVAGAKRVEHIEIRQRQASPRTPAAAPKPPAPAPSLPQ